MVSNATCAVCHHPLPAEALVCPNCGTPVAQSSTPAGAGEKARPEVPTAWAAFAPPAPAHAGTNGNAPAPDPSPADSGAPAAETIAPLDSTAPLPVRPAGTLATGRPDADPAAGADMPVPTILPAPAALPATSAQTTWLAGEPSPPPVALAPAPVLTPVTATATLPVADPAAPAATTPAAPPTGALVLLRGEEVVMQLGALYLTNRRAILYAPTILRAAFLRDIDAIGTVTERSSGWMLLFGLLGLGLAAVSAYVGISQPSAEFKLGEVYSASPVLLAIPLALIGILALASYFFWIKRSLFLSVGGRPLIVVSISGWSGKKLTAVDAFVNAFSQAKESDQGQGS